MAMPRELPLLPPTLHQQPGKKSSSATFRTALAAEGISHKERQECLWQQFFQEPTEWCDNRLDKRTARCPDFRHKASKEPLWLNNRSKPSWVDSELARLDGRMSESARLVKILSKRCKDAQVGEAVDALELLEQQGCQVTDSLICRVLNKCEGVEDLELVRRVHAVAVRCGYESNAFLANHFIVMYASLGTLEDAFEVFIKVGAPNVYVWSAIVLAHVRHGQPRKGIEIYRQLRDAGVKPNDRVFVAVLKACAVAGDLSAGKEVHADMQGCDLQDDVFVGNSLVNMYAKCGGLEDACSVFDKMATKDVVSWNAMITGYTQQGQGREALALYVRMQQEGINPADRVSFVSLLRACASVGALQQGMQLHSKVRELGLEADVRVGSCLVDMYAKCGSLTAARRVFDSLSSRDVVTWNAMMTGYAQQSRGQDALALYSFMEEESIIVANDVTFACLLQACAGVGALQQGERLHCKIRERGLEADGVIANCLVNMYVKCGKLEDARKVFDSLPTKDAVTWTAMISGYSQHDLGGEALDVYASMQKEGITPANNVTFACLLQACASVGALQQGRHLHSQIHYRGLEADAVIGNCLLDMYAKCGSLEEARSVFDRLPTRDTVAWNAMLTAYADNGNGEMAIKCFNEMLVNGCQPDATTFICLLVACSQAGLVYEGRKYFGMMGKHGIQPTDYHHSCMVDLLGRAGHLVEAERILLTVSFANDVVGWTALLSACKSFGDVDRGTRCFEHLVGLEPQDASPYVLLGNMYANAGRWDDVDRIESLRKSSGARKKRAKAFIELSSVVHEFAVGDERYDISTKLKNVNTRLQDEGGHVPQTGLVLKAVSEQEKEDSLCGHAEKLALAYGLLNTPDGTTLLVTKNLRMCSDCHSSTKIMSRLEKRAVIVRDSHRVHRFKDGSCSCADRI